MLYGLGGINLLVAFGVWNVGKAIQRRRRSDDEAGFGFQTIREDTYLRRVALTVLLLGAAGVLVDYAMKAEADARYADSAALLSFFAIFYMATSLLTFVTQAGAAKPLLEKIGLSGTMDGDSAVVRRAWRGPRRRVDGAMDDYADARNANGRFQLSFSLGI